MQPQSFEEEVIPHPLTEQIEASFIEMRAHQVKQYYTREIKKSSYLEIGLVDIHEDCLLLELQRVAYDQLRLFGISNEHLLLDITSKF